MGSIAKTLLRSILKMVNSLMGMVGISMILYSLWMARVWQRDMEGSSIHGFDSTAPWFIYAFLSVGITLCLITCIGHISADSSNSFCLSCYTVIIFFLVLLEIAIAADILLNSDWEKDLPEDPTGRFHDFKEFIESNFDVFKWIGLLIVLAQGCSILLAMALRSIRLDYRSSNYESDDEYSPLINHPYVVVGDPNLSSKNDAWNAKNTDSFVKRIASNYEENNKRATC